MVASEHSDDAGIAKSPEHQQVVILNQPSGADSIWMDGFDIDDLSERTYSTAEEERHPRFRKSEISHFRLVHGRGPGPGSTREWYAITNQFEAQVARKYIYFVELSSTSSIRDVGNIVFADGNPDIAVRD